MAILEKLRVKAGLLLAIVIGLSLAAFILSDFLDSGGSLFNRSKYEIAEVSGKSVAYTDYENLVTKLERIQQLQSGQTSLDENTMDQIRSITWDNMIQDMLLEKQYEKTGVTVSSEELSEMIMGENPHPYIAQLFTDQRTGVLNRQYLNAFMQRVNSDEPSDEKEYYLYIENEIIRQRKNTKYLNLIRKGLYATNFEAKRQQDESSLSVDLDFIVKGFNSMSDSAIRVSDKEISKYYKQNLNLFKQTESRDIRYITFDVIPSGEDTLAAKKWIDETKPEFEESEDIKQFVNMESDEPFDEINHKNGELNDTINDFMFNAQIGASFGPYYLNGAFRISRLAAIHYLPDSVKARHILLQVTQDNVNTVKNTADSLVDMIKKGADFGMLAMVNSIDGSAQTGGDLGWFREGQMVKSFSDSCFFAKKGDIKIVASQYGLHIVQIMDQSKPVKKVQVGTVAKKITASEETDNDYYIRANEFAGVNDTYDKFNAAVESKEMSSSAHSAMNILPMDKKVNDLESARTLVSWVYKAELHDVSTVFKFGDQYLVAVVDKVREHGNAPLADVKADIENRIKQEKKAEEITAELKLKTETANTIEDLAKSLGLQAEPVSGIKFTSSSLGSAGVEPEVIAAAWASEKGKISPPVVGENGVYVFSVKNISTPAQNEDMNVSRNYVERNYAALANYYAYEALKELANIIDNRREFY
jgi:peptidyl-prolyl cis-trans isomerase D